MATSVEHRFTIKCANGNCPNQLVEVTINVESDPSFRAIAVVSDMIEDAWRREQTYFCDGCGLRKLKQETRNGHFGVAEAAI